VPSKLSNATEGVLLSNPSPAAVTRKKKENYFFPEKQHARDQKDAN
jgi:hypothetical protein